MDTHTYYARLFQHMIREGWVKRRSAPKLKGDHDEKGPTPSSHQQSKLERQVTKTASEQHQEQHLQIERIASYSQLNWVIFTEESVRPGLIRARREGI